MEKPKLLQEHINIGTVYYYFNNVFQTASEPRKICKIVGEKFYYGTNSSEYNTINDNSLYLIHLHIERYMGYIECSETTSLLHNELRAYLMMKKGGLNDNYFDFNASYAHYFINENNQISRDLINLNRSSHYNDTSNFLEWASRNQVKSNKKTYKVGDYIVCLDNANPNPGQYKSTLGGSGFVKNTCFKIIRIKNIKEYQVLFFENHINGIYNNSVRPATTNEITKYNLLGSHYDVVNDRLVGRYLKALVNNPCGTTYKKEDYILISKDYLDGSVECFSGMSFGNKKYDWTACGVELMPEKFSPESINSEEEFKTGDWIIRKSNEFNLPNITTGKIYKAGEIILNENIVHVIDNSEISCRFLLNRFRKATKEEIDAFTQKQKFLPKPGEWVYFYEFTPGCVRVGPTNQAYLVTDRKATSGLIYNSPPNFNVINNSGVVWTVNGNYRQADDREITISRLTLPMAQNPPEYENTVNFAKPTGVPPSIPKNWCLKVTKENFDCINSVRYMPISVIVNGYYITSELNHIDNKKSWRATFHVANYIEITLHQFKKYVLRDIKTENSYNNYGAAIKQSEETNSSLTNSNSEKVIKLIKPQPKKMSIDSVLSMNINLRTNKKTTQIKI